MSLTRQIPGLAEALAAEARARAEPFLNLPHVLCGVEVRALSLRDYTRLIYDRSPFVCGGTPDRRDVALLLFYQQRHPDLALETREFAAQFDALDLGEMTIAVESFVSRFLLDAPQGGGNSAPTVSLADSMVHLLRASYPGTTEDQVLDMDLRKVWGSYRCIQRERDPKVVLFNKLSDGVKSRWLASINAQESTTKLNRPVKKHLKQKPQSSRH